MANYFIIINNAKREYIDSRHVGSCGRAEVYSVEMSNLIGWLTCPSYLNDPDYTDIMNLIGCVAETFEKAGVDVEDVRKSGQRKEPYYLGHWNGDKLKMVSEYKREYNVCCRHNDVIDTKRDDEWIKKTNELGRQEEKARDKRFNITKEEVKRWTDITAPLVKEWDWVAKEHYRGVGKISVITYGNRGTLPVNWCPFTWIGP